MSTRIRFAGLLAIVLIVSSACAIRSADGRDDPWRVLARKIMSADHPDSTAVIVLFDEDVLQGLRSRLPQSFKVVPFKHPDVPLNDAFAPAQLGQMHREAMAATASRPDVWVVGRRSSSKARMRAAIIADLAIQLDRSRVLRDSVRTPQGTVEFARWVDRPGGVAQRVEMLRRQAYAESVLARGLPRLTPITRPFTRSELKIDPDTLSYCIAELADTSFYSIGGCSDVEIVNWSAPQRLSELGPGVVPALVARIADSDPFVRERVEESLLLVTQDERILARTNGEYLKFYDQPEGSSRAIVRAWWAKFGHFWTPADSTR